MSIYRRDANRRDEQNTEVLRRIGRNFRRQVAALEQEGVHLSHADAQELADAEFFHQTSQIDPDDDGV